MEILRERQRGFDLGWLSDSRNEIYGLAILWVMMFHGNDWNNLNYSLGFSWLKPLSGFVNLGNSGVDMFLLLSGISLYFSFSRRPPLLGFYKKRYQRLFPALWMINGAYWIYLAFVERLQQGVSLPGVGGHLLLRATQLSFWFGNDRQVWYVAAIAAFYFLYPFLYQFLFEDARKTGRRAVFLVVFTVAVLLSARVVYAEMYERLEIALCRLPIFVLGCALGKLVYERRKISWWWLVLSAAYIVAVLGLCLFGYIRWGSDGGAQAVFDLRVWLKNHALWRYQLSLFGLSMTLLVGWLLHLLSWKPLHAFFKFFGNMSLELYLAHVTVHHVARLDFWWGPERFTFAKYYAVILIAIPVAFVTMKIENALFSKKPKKETAPAA